MKGGIPVHPLQRDCPRDNPKKFAAWCWAAGIPDPSPVRPHPIPLIMPQLVEGLSEMLWDFGFRHHPTKQTKWIEGTAGLGMIAKLADKAPKVDPIEVLAEEFLAVENPKLLEFIKKAPPEQRVQLVKDLEKNFEVIQSLMHQLKNGSFWPDEEDEA